MQSAIYRASGEPTGSELFNRRKVLSSEFRIVSNRESRIECLEQIASNRLSNPRTETLNYRERRTVSQSQMEFLTQLFRVIKAVFEF